MKQMVVISGKGGTGKTSLAAAFAGLSDHAVIADCDVDAANLHMILGPLQERVKPIAFECGFMASLDTDRCTGCGQCLEVCRFGAITLHDGLPRIDSVSCEGCGSCADACPGGAIRLHDRLAGQIFLSQSRFGPLIRGKLGIAQSSSGKLVTRVRAIARELAETEGHDCILVDGSPGIGCPVIASLTGADTALVVTEPTVSGRHDLKRALELCRHFSIPVFVAINKYDLNSALADDIGAYARSCKAEVVGRIRYDRAFTEAMVASRTIIEYSPGGEAAASVRSVWEKWRSHTA